MSHDLNCQYFVGIELKHTIFFPLFLAIATIPSAILYLGPLGPSGVIAISFPSFNSFNALIITLAPPLELEPLIAPIPSLDFGINFVVSLKSRVDI